MNEKLTARFAVVKKVVDELDYAGLLDADAAGDEYDGESMLISLSANPALGVQKNALMIGFVFSYLFNDPKPAKPGVTCVLSACVKRFQGLRMTLPTRCWKHRIS